MTEAKHTPGPWQQHDDAPVYGPGYASTVWSAKGPGHGLVADCRQCSSFEEERANARLIAAAPDMLACLIEIRALITEAGLTGFNCHEGDWAERLFATQAASHAAVRKATGA
jgi:hypothetical protein